MVWRHVVIGTRGSWLHGDPRGFRSRGHRIHSSGDYKNPPPEGEHEGLHIHHEARSGEVVELDTLVRVIICREFVLKMRSIGVRVIACTAGKLHLHALAEMPDDYERSMRFVGRAKQKASAVRDKLPGTIWSTRGSFKQIRGKGHLRNSYKYLRMGQEVGAIVWSHNDQENWIDDESLGIVVMVAKKTQGRLTRPQAGV